MKNTLAKLLLLSTTVLLVTALTGAEPKTDAEKEPEWLTDLNKAKQVAVEKKRPILINFSGSDWCGWCIKLDKEVFATEQFQKYADANLVLFLADFPRQKKLPEEQATQNRKLADEYGVRGYPTILLLDNSGDVIARTGYKPGGPEAYVNHLQELLKKNR